MWKFSLCIMRQDCDSKIVKKAVAVYFKFFSLNIMITALCVFFLSRTICISFTYISKARHPFVCLLSNAEDKMGTIDIKMYALQFNTNTQHEK